MKKIIFCINFILLLSNILLSQKIKKVVSINFYDSIGVEKVIARSSLCEKIRVVELNKVSFCKEVGFCMLILKSISLQTKKYIYIPYANGGFILTRKQQVMELQEQLNPLKIEFNCVQKKAKNSM